MLRVLVGLRPSRSGGPRLEVERLPLVNGAQSTPVLLCHSYGHHSAGFEGSVGAARATVEMLVGALQRRS